MSAKSHDIGAAEFAINDIPQNHRWKPGRRNKIHNLTSAVLLFITTLSMPNIHHAAEETSATGSTTITLIQIGDIHGHLIPRPSLRSDATGPEGGLARMYTRIKEIRARNRNTLLFNTGDTIQGSAEALYTRGQAVVGVLDRFGIDGFAPGNWDYVYGAKRFIELFGDGRWGGVAMNVYYDGHFYPDRGNQLVLPAYRVKKIGGIKIGIMGLSSERAINALGNWATQGLIFTADAHELPGYIDLLRNRERVDVLILLSEFGLAKNVLLAEKYPGIDVILSSDMHEETPNAVIAKTGTLVSEAGQDGTQLAEVRLSLENRRVVDRQYVWHTITANIPADPGVDKQIGEIRRAFVSGRDFRSHTNPFNGTVLKTPIDTVVGQAQVPLYRANFSQDSIPAVIEGSSHDMLADAFRHESGADIGHIRGFRYGTHIAPGPIKLEDIYHFIPIGPQIATIKVTGQTLKNNIENSADGALNPDPFKWTGGWLNGYSGVRFELDAYASRGNRARNILVKRAGKKGWEPLNLAGSYSFAGYWYEQDPQVVGGISTTGSVTPVRGDERKKLDATQVVVEYLEEKPADPEMPRVTLLAPLPAPVYGNPEIQPLLGVPTTQ